jgi:hypothetical protein
MKAQFLPLTSQLPTTQERANIMPPAPAATGVERVLCVHCERTATNGNQCKWICKREQMERAAAAKSN